MQLGSLTIKMTSFSYVLSGIWSKKGGVPFALTRYQVEKLAERRLLGTSIATLTNATGVVVAHNVYSLSLVIRSLRIIGEATTTTTCEDAQLRLTKPKHHTEGSK